MTEADNRRGELSRHRAGERAPADPPPRPNRETKDDGRGRDASRTGSDSNRK